MANLQEIIAHPDFQGLPDAEKQKALVELIPGFGDLPQEEQMKGMAEIMGRVSQPQPAAPVQTPPQAPTDYTSESLGQFQPGNIPEIAKQAATSELGQGFINQLPVAGMMVGGTAGGLLGGPIGAPVGAALGAGIGQAGRGLVQESLGIRPPQLPMQNWADIGRESMFGAGAEMAGPLLAKGVQKVISPFAASTAERMATDESVKAAQQLVQAGAPISPDIINPSRTAKFFNWLTEKVWPASSMVAKKRASLQDTANALQEEFVNSRGLYNTSKGGVNQAWENWVNMAGGAEAPYELPKTLEIITQASKKPFAMELKAGEEVPVGAFWKKYASTFKQSLEENGQVTVQEIRDLLNVLNPTGAKGAERTWRMKIGDAIMEDLGKSGNQEMVEALSSAKDLARLQRIAGPLQNIFNRSMIEPTKAGEEMVFNPDNFVKLWNQRRGWFVDNKNYSAEDVRVIDAFASKMKALVPDLARAAKFKSDTPLMGVFNPNLQNPLGMAALAYKYPAVAIPAGLDAGLAISLMNPNGVLRKFLTTGFNPPNLTAKMGLMKTMEGAND